jgi:membrane associated rhomboid family serine protease
VSGLSESDEDAILPVAIGTVVWLVALVALVVMRPTLDENGTEWWIGVAAVGAVSGLLGLVFLRWRKGRARRRGQE